jgi:hypothetical protein
MQGVEKGGASIGLMDMAVMGNMHVFLFLAHAVLPKALLLPYPFKLVLECQCVCT